MATSQARLVVQEHSTGFKEVKVNENKVPSDHKKVSLHVTSTGGIFWLDLKLENHSNLERVELIVDGVAACEGLSLEKGDDNIDLKSNNHVHVNADSTHRKCTITFEKSSLATLAQGGRLQFIDYYR
eukprot:TRINITY_DN485_c0_g2_i1.p1 TRINITY_DN485_c0_g2~~TRINITY_DN485_c0_g2_i1.p1  ORF type:complete len:127 (-),score=21.80 TRINITY_DN485_c0_g2_i1:41-421(-)